MDIDVQLSTSNFGLVCHSRTADVVIRLGGHLSRTPRPMSTITNRRPLTYQLQTPNDWKQIVIGASTCDDDDDDVIECILLVIPLS